MADLEKTENTARGRFITTDHNVKINNDHDRLKAVERSPSLLEDLIMREKIMHFDHERAPQRIVHIPVTIYF